MLRKHVTNMTLYETEKSFLSRKKDMVGLFHLFSAFLFSSSTMYDKSKLLPLSANPPPAKKKVDPLQLFVPRPNVDAVYYEEVL